MEISRFNGIYRFLSNFFPCYIIYNDIEYKTAEHAYQASKASTKDDREWVREASTPSEAKRRGRFIVQKPNWGEEKLSIMYDILVCKFTHPTNIHLKEQLINTGNKLLVEGNIWGDTYWGVDIATGEGANHLGKLLMKIREAL